MPQDGFRLFLPEALATASQPMWEFFSLINQQSTEGQSRKKKIWKIDVKMQK